MKRERAALSVALGYFAAVSLLVGLFSVVRPIAVSGGSMRPALVPGDLVLVLQGGSTSQGDIALIERPGRSAVLHRVRAIRQDGSLLTKGDANHTADRTPVPSTAVKGVVVAVVPFGRLIERWQGLKIHDTLSAQSDSARR